MDQQTYSKEEIKKRLDSLPPEIQNFLYSAEVDSIVQQIGAKNKLHLDQTGLLLIKINDVMIGFMEAADLPDSLSNILQIDKEKASLIAKDVDEMLFSKIREAMKKVYEANKAAPAEAPSAPAAVASVPTPNPASKLPPLPSTLPTAFVPTAMPTAPSAVKPVPTPVTNIPTPTPMPPPPQKPVEKPAMHAADIMLSEKTVTVATPAVPKAAPATPPTPGSYKKDPYREPAE